MEAGEATAPWWAVANEEAQLFLKTRDKQQPDPLTKNWLTDSANIRSTVLGSVCHVSYTLLGTFIPMETLSSYSLASFYRDSLGSRGKNHLPTFKKTLLISTIEPYQCFQLHNQRLLIKALAVKLRSLQRGHLNSGKVEKQHKVKICHRSAEMILAPFDRSTNAEAPSAATHSSPCKNCLVPRRDHHGNHHKSYAGACTSVSAR